MNELPCLLCSSSHTGLKLTSKDYLVHKGCTEDFTIYVCKNCTNGFSYPFLTNQELEKYYPEKYECYKSKKGIPGSVQRWKSVTDVRLVQKYLSKGRVDIFEIGPGSGLFLSLLKERGFHVSGVEPSSSGVKYAKENFNIEIENEYFDHYDSESKFDMILAFHVIEHFNDPVSAINKIKTYLREEGYVFFKLPRLDSWAAKLYGKFWHGFDLPRHRVHFTKQGVLDMAKSNGFEVVMFKSDYDPLASLRFIFFSGMHSKGKMKSSFWLIDRLPYLFKLVVAVVVEFIMSPFKCGKDECHFEKKEKMTKEGLDAIHEDIVPHNF